MMLLGDCELPVCVVKEEVVLNDPKNHGNSFIVASNGGVHR